VIGQRISLQGREEVHKLNDLVIKEATVTELKSATKIHIPRQRV